jgi:hypothetical protein
MLEENDWDYIMADNSRKHLLLRSLSAWWQEKYTKSMLIIRTERSANIYTALLCHH